MRSFLYILLLLFSSSLCFAQNYQCLQSGVKHYFINGNNYLRGIRIDSVRYSGDTTIYYPFKTPRGPYLITASPYTPSDTTGGSWLGGQVIGLSDGTFVFDNYWGNRVEIHSQASVGDNWLFYSDGSPLYYKASVISMDTMSVLGVIDSIKRIQISAFDSSGFAVSDSANGYSILLSKEHGFVQVFDLYTFPYHKPDSSYRSGLDFFLDRSTHDFYTVNSYGGTQPGRNNAIFKLVKFINPNDIELHNWSVGDVFEWRDQDGLPIPPYPSTLSYVLDTVYSTSIVPNGIAYYLQGETFNSSYPYNRSFHNYTSTYLNTSYTIIDSNKMPESQIGMFAPRHVFYFPDDTGWCVRSPLYIVTLPQYEWGLGGVAVQNMYKLGTGLVYHYLQDGNPDYESYSLIYYKHNGNLCGNITWPVGINDVNKANDIKISPNPTDGWLDISSSDPIERVEILDMVGHLIQSENPNAQKINLDICRFPSGTYLIRINNSFVQRFTKQ